MVLMPLAPLPLIDTRFFFRPVSTDLVRLLRGLERDDWARPTVAGAWQVRDVVAHLVDLTFRRLSFHRDGMIPPPPPHAIESDRDFVRFINWLNAEWVQSAKRFSPRVLTDLFAKASADLADWFEQLPLEAPALFGVSWAGERESEGWFDIGREFTELWHHQEQIRLAVGAPSLADPRYLRAVIAIAVRGLPHALRDVSAGNGQALVLEVTGSAGATYSLVRESGRWSIQAGEAEQATARVRLSDETAWKLLFNALKAQELAENVHLEGDRELGKALLNARSVIV
jgi:uncharacterized protein (TIGR03083 family)